MLVLSKYTKEFSYNLKLSIPVILGLLGHTTVAFVDNIMVGNIGPTELAAVSLGNSFLFISMGLGIGFTTAITPIVAERDSENNILKIKQIFKHSMVLCFFIGLFLVLLVYGLKPLIFLMNQPLDVIELSIKYLDVVLFSLIPLVLFQGLKQFSDGLSKTKYPMYATLIANIVNVFLNYILIFGHLGFPKMGIVGAALGTLIARLIMFLILLFFAKYNKQLAPYTNSLRHILINLKMLKLIIFKGLPAAFQMLFEVLAFTSSIWISGVIGVNTQAANQIALNLSSMTFMVAMGLSTVAMIRVGNQKGLKDLPNLWRIALSIFLLIVIFDIIFATSFIIFNKYLPTIYLDNSNLINLKDNKEVILIASKLLIVSAAFQIFDGLQVVILGALRGVQDFFKPSVISFFSYLIGVSVSVYLGLYTSLKSVGIWIGLCFGLALTSLLLYKRFRKVLSNLTFK